MIKLKSLKDKRKNKLFKNKREGMFFGIFLVLALFLNILVIGYSLVKNLAAKLPGKKDK